MDASGSFYEEERNAGELLHNFINSRLQAKFRQLERIWQEQCADEAEVMRHCGAAVHHLDNLLQELVGEAQNSLRMSKKRVEEAKSDLRNLYKELGDAPIEPILSGGLEEQVRLLQDLVKSLNDRKKARLDKYSNLHREDKLLSEALGCNPECYLDGLVPTEQDLNILENHIIKLRATKAERTRQYTVTKDKIMAIIDELEAEPQNDFEERVVCEDIDMFTLSSYNMECLNMYCEQLSDRLKKARREADDLRSSIEEIWSRIPEQDRGPQDFFIIHCDCRCQTIKALKEEVARCRRVRLANLNRLIHEARNEIRQWWVKCYFTREQSEEFTAYKSCDFTEELLEAHDKELARLKRFYSDYEALFKNIAKRGELFKRYLELEKNATDPNRFSNRGGQLLKEEKERKYLSKELPQIDKSIGNEIAEWELETGKQFLVEGVPYSEYVSNQWQEQERKKKIEKDLRSRIKQHQTNTEVLYGSRMTVTTKRRLPVTPGAAMSTLLAPCEENNAPTNKRGRVDVSKVHSSVRVQVNQSRPQVTKDNKSITTRSRQLRRSNRLLHAPAAHTAIPGAVKKSGIPAPSAARGTMPIGGGVVVERGTSALRSLRLVNKMVASSPARPRLQDETLRYKDAIVASGPVMAIADSGIDCSVASVGPYHDFALPMRTSEDNDSTRL